MLHRAVGIAAAGLMLLDEQLLETTRHVANLAVHQNDVAVEAGRRRLVAEQFANEAVILRHNVFQAPAKVPNLHQHLGPSNGVASISF
jgi:hypothetical protein